MPDGLARAVAVALLVVHAGLGIWAAVGVAELAWADVPWGRVSNPAFSTSMLLLQWLLVAIAATVFIGGYLTRFPHTPTAMAVIYAAMAGVCAYQTFFILTNDTRFAAMAIEYLEYAVILVFLFRSKHMRLHFGSAAHGRGPV